MVISHWSLLTIKAKLNLAVWSVFLIKSILILFVISSFKTWEDTDIALNLLHTGEFKMMHRGIYDYCFQFPVFSFIQFLIFKMGLGLPSISVFQVLISSAIAYLLYYIIFGFIDLFDFPIWVKIEKEIIAFWSAAAFLMHPPISYYQIVNIHPFTLDQFFFFLIIFLVIRFIKEKKISTLILLGAAMGMGALSRSTLLIVWVPVIIIFFNYFSFKKALKYTFIVTALSMIVLFPWIYRNYNIYNKLLITTTTGEIIWKGSIHGSDGGNHLTDGRHYLDVLTNKEKEQIDKMDVLQRQNFFFSKYFDILKNDPAQIVKMYFVKLKNFWWFRSQLGIDYSQSLQNYLMYYKLGYIVILIGAIAGIILLGKNILYLLSFPLVLSLLQSVFYVETRHRMVIEPFLIFLTITSIFYILFFRKEKVKAPQVPSPKNQEPIR